MYIEKVINNNIISAYDETGQEIVVMGRGIGYSKKPQMKIEEEKIEKIFRIDNKQVVNRFKELLIHMPLKQLQISSQVISYAKKKLKVELNQNIYVTLTDHINFSILRYQKGMRLENALLWVIKRFYPEEFLVGMYAVHKIYEVHKINFGEDEAGFIALHFVNAEYNTNSMDEAVKMTSLVQGAISIVETEYCRKLDEHSLHYERFITHMKFLAQRVYQNELLEEEDEEFTKMICKKYKKEYRCSKRIAALIKETFDIHIPNGEVVYLTIHIKRVLMRKEERRGKNV